MNYICKHKVKHRRYNIDLVRRGLSDSVDLNYEELTDEERKDADFKQEEYGYKCIDCG